jgi:hypothetical protein
MTIFFMFSIALVAAKAFFLLGAVSNWPICFGMICHESPNLSLSQPHCSDSGTADRLFQK